MDTMNNQYGCSGDALHDSLSAGLTLDPALAVIYRARERTHGFHLAVIEGSSVSLFFLAQKRRLAL